MKVLGIGNAIVDVICKIEENFITKNNLTKGTMKLVDETEFKKLLSSLKIQETIAGGSVANSIVGLSQLGNSVSATSFIVLLVRLFSDKKLSSTLQITSTIAFPIPNTFI